MLTGSYVNLGEICEGETDNEMYTSCCIPCPGTFLMSFGALEVLLFITHSAAVFSRGNDGVNDFVKLSWTEANPTILRGWEGYDFF